MTLQQATPLLEQLKTGWTKGDLDSCLQLLAKLKVAMLSFSSLPPAPPTKPEELLLAREVLEYGALISIKAVDIPAFERHVAQLKTYYNDCSLQPESQRRFPILGLNLLRLLAQNRIAEFHTELELLPSELQTSNLYIKFPAQLEQHIMEGSYNRVLSAKQEGLYAQEGMYFMDQLVNTVREEIAECSEKAYSSISSVDLQNLLMLGSSDELADFAQERGWTIQAGTVTFGGADEKPQQLPSTQLIQETLAYAKELERII